MSERTTDLTDDRGSWGGQDDPCCTRESLLGVSHQGATKAGGEGEIRTYEPLRACGFQEPALASAWVRRVGFRA